MKKNDVKIGQSYMAKVTNSVVPVRIDAVNSHGGWDGKNIASGRKVRIKSAQRLRRKCTEADLVGLKRPTAKRSKKVAKVAISSPTSPTVAKPSKESTKDAAKAKGRDTGQTGAKVAKPAKPKRISGLTAAFMVLVDADSELGVKAIVKIAAEKGWWESKAKTPHATVYSAMIREIATKGKASRFKRGTARGTFRALCTPEQKRELFGTKA